MSESRLPRTTASGRGSGDFYNDRCDFTMSKVSAGFKFWVQYEGVPGGEMNDSDFWYNSVDRQRHPINESFIGDLPSPEWMAFGDQNSPRMLYVLHHEDDDHPDDYVSRPPHDRVRFLAVEKKNKFLDTVQTFSIGFVESTDYLSVERAVLKAL